MQEDTLRKVDQFKLLTETGPDTPMGKLLRKFWHPIALGEEVAKGKARAVRVLGEDLTLYRGDSGEPHLIGGRCAHRCTVLHTGVVQGEQIRCMYHGWRYDGTGLCTEIPAEKQPRRRPRPPSICRASTRSKSPVASSSRTSRSGTATGSSTWRTRSTRCT
jgi:phenylpropionate dioxygenase-like ring-hydroxylating dioxygenase large terminal subunit